MSPASILPLPPERDAGRHAHLAQMITGESEVTLTDELIDAMTGSLFDPMLVPAHVASVVYHHGCLTSPRDYRGLAVQWLPALGPSSAPNNEKLRLGVVAGL